MLQSFITMFIAVFVAAIVEIVLSLCWIPFYFRYGIRIFYKRIPYHPSAKPLPQDSELAELLKGKWGQSLVFKSISESEIAFREKALEIRLFNSTPVMHGLIRISASDGQIEVMGHLNWFIIVFTGLLIALSSAIGFQAFFLLFFAAILVLCFLVQSQRYKRVVQVLEEIGQRVV